MTNESLQDSTNSTARFSNDKLIYHFYRLLQRYGVAYMLLLITIGFLGNTLSCYVFIRSKLKRLSCSSYLIALSLSDSGYLICLGLIWLENIRIYVFHNDGICQMVVYLTAVFSSLSVWFTVAFTSERFLVVAYPLKRSQYNSRRRARYVIFLLSSIAFIFNCSSLWTSGIEISRSNSSNSIRYEKRCVTLPQWLNFARLMNLTDFILTFIIPFSTIATLNTLIVFKSGQYDRLLERNCAQQTSPLVKDFLGHRVRHLKYHRRITKMLLTVSTSFLLLNTPMHLMKVYYFLSSNDQNLDTTNHLESIIEMLTFYLFYTNFAINFFLYSLCGKNFRSCLVDLVKRIGKTHSTSNLFLHASENGLAQIFHRSHASQRLSKFSKREMSSTLSIGALHGNNFQSTNNLTGIFSMKNKSLKLHPGFSNSSLKVNSFRTELLTTATVHFNTSR